MIDSILLAAMLVGPPPTAPVPPPSMTRLLRSIQGAFSGDRAHEVTAFVAQYWRVPGNAGFNASIFRIVDVLASNGFVEESKAGKEARLVYRVERRPMSRPTWEPVGGSVTIVGDRSPLLDYVTNRHLVTVNSASTPPGGVEGEVVRIERPTQLDSMSLDGRIVYVSGSPQGWYSQAIRRGTLGVIGYSMPSYLKPEINVHSIQFGQIPLDTTRAGWGILLSTAAKRRLDAAMANGMTRLRVDLTTKIYRADELTLVAEIRGRRAPNQRFVFSAHVQEPGANDNASGVGALTEMARVTGELFKAGRIDPDRTITFLWGDEISSTRRYIQEDSVRARGVIWGTSLDMVGEDTEKTGGTFLIEKMPDPSAVWTRGEDRHTEWGGRPLSADSLRPHFFNDFILARCLEQAAGNGWVVRTNPFEGGSDHTPFLNAKKPAVLLWHFTDQFYHTDGDRIENVSATELANVGISALYAALVLSTPTDASVAFLTREVESAATARLAIEATLSRTAIAAGGPPATERVILETWNRWYQGAIESIGEIPLASSATVRAAIQRSKTTVAQRAAAAVRSLVP